MHRIKSLRSKLGYTQQELANKAGLSLRTIQRVESGITIPKGHTLKVLSKALEVEPDLFAKTTEKINIDVIKAKIRLINLSALALFGIPFGNIILPIIFWKKNKKINPLINDAGKQIINFQIWWSVFLSIILSLSPFIQSFFFPKFSLILVALFACICINLIFIARVAIQIKKGNYTFFKPNWSLL